MPSAIHFRLGDRLLVEESVDDVRQKLAQAGAEQPVQLTTTAGERVEVIPDLLLDDPQAAVTPVGSQPAAS
jgi:hypothetical protein